MPFALFMAGLGHPFYYPDTNKEAMRTTVTQEATELTSKSHLTRREYEPISGMYRTTTTPFLSLIVVPRTEIIRWFPSDTAGSLSTRVREYGGDGLFVLTDGRDEEWGVFSRETPMGERMLARFYYIGTSNNEVRHAFGLQTRTDYYFTLPTLFTDHGMRAEHRNASYMKIT